MTSLSQVVDYLLGYTSDLKRDYHLDRMRQLLNALGNPQDQYKSIHVAGTSGKTSTSYFIRALLEAAGQKTGLTVSPHIVAVNERVQIGGVPLPEDAFLDYFNEFISLVEASGETPTYFETLVAFAFWVFVKVRVDYAVIETGMGGLLDGTNTITRADKLCVITNIGLDHTHILGHTVEEIALQKAGIIQPRNHAVVRSQQASVTQVLHQYATRQQATVEVVKSHDAPAFLPDFQHQNWALAMAAFEHVRIRDELAEVSNEACEAAAHHTPPGRGEMYRIGDKTLILDGAHNPQKLEALLSSLRAAGFTSAAVLANIVEAPDSKLEQCVALFESFASHWIIPEFQVGQDVMSRRSFQPEYVLQYARLASVETTTDVHHALQSLLARPEKTLLITGSLYLVSLLRPTVLQLQGE